MNDVAARAGRPPAVRILSASSALQEVSSWRCTTTFASDVIPSWDRRTLVFRAIALACIGRHFDVLVLQRDARLAVLAGCMLRLARARTRLVLQEMYCDIARYESPGRRLIGRRRDLPSYCFYWLVARVMAAIVVHTSAEASMYARTFRVPAATFEFIPYFVYLDAMSVPEPKRQTQCNYILAIGRHRDFDCFINAMEGVPCRGVIVAGTSDRREIGNDLPACLEAHYEVSREEYRRWIAGAAVVVIPLYPDRWLRSLGQIAVFEAILMRRPVVVARTFQLADYVNDDEVFFYEAGDSRSLRHAIERALDEPSGRNATGALERIVSSFTADVYAARVFDLCNRLAPRTRSLLRKR